MARGTTQEDVFMYAVALACGEAVETMFSV